MSPSRPLLGLALVALLASSLRAGPSPQQLLAMAQKGDLQAASFFVLIGSMDEVALQLDPEKPAIRAWKDSTQELKGMTGRQVYGSLLAHRASRQPGLPFARRRALLQEALEHLTSGSFQRGVRTPKFGHGLLAAEAAELAAFLEPADKVAHRYRTTAASLLLSDGLSRKGPPPVWLTQVVAAASLLRHPDLAKALAAGASIPLESDTGKKGAFRGSPDQIVATLEKAFPPGLPPEMRTKALERARAYQPFLPLAQYEAEREASRPDLHWYGPEDLDRLLTGAMKRPVLVYFSLPFGPSKWVEERVLARDGVREYLATHFDAVRFDVHTKDVIRFRGKDYRFEEGSHSVVRRMEKDLDIPATLAAGKDVYKEVERTYETSRASAHGLAKLLVRSPCLAPCFYFFDRMPAGISEARRKELFEGSEAPLNYVPDPTDHEAVLAQLQLVAERRYLEDGEG